MGGNERPAKRCQCQENLASKHPYVTTSALAASLSRFLDTVLHRNALVFSRVVMTMSILPGFGLGSHAPWETKDSTNS